MHRQKIKMQANYGKDRPPSPSKSAYSGSGRERGNSGLSIGVQDTNSNSVGTRTPGPQVMERLAPRDSISSMGYSISGQGASRLSNVSNTSAKSSNRQTPSPLLPKHKDRGCPLHSKPLEVFCASASCLTLVCADCALFGPHQHHTFKQVEEVKRVVVSEVDRLNQIRDQLWRGYQWSSDNPALKGWQEQSLRNLSAKVSEVENFFEVISSRVTSESVSAIADLTEGDRR